MDDGELPSSVRPSFSGQRGGASLASQILLAMAAFSAILMAGLGWSSQLRVVDSAPAIIGAGFLVLLLPGLAIGELTRARARHPLQVISDAFFYSVLVCLASALIGFFVQSSIQLVVLMIAGVTLASLLSARLLCREGLISTLPSMRLSPAEAAWWLLVLGALGAAMFRTADKLGTVGFEVAVHLSYVRQYASGLPLDIQAATLRDAPEFLVPNLFFLWEFLLALVSSVAHTDPVVAALRSRWLVPILGLSGLYSVAREITHSDRGARTLTSMLALLCLSGFVFLEPSQLSVLPREGVRGVMAFWGSIHHSDTAMEILLPLLLARLLAATRRSSWGNVVSLGLGVTISFFWHPRETFQIAWYSTILFVTVSLLYLVRREALRQVRNTAVALVVVLATAGATALACRLASPGTPEFAEQVDRKARIWSDPRAAGATRFANPFYTPTHGIGGPASPPPSTYSFLVAAALLLPGVLLTSRSSRRFTLFFVAVWLATLCVGAVQWLLLLATYSEILFGAVRFVFLLAYPVICLGFIGTLAGVGRALGKTSIVTPAVLLSTLGLGGLFRAAWEMDQPSFRGLLLMGPLWLAIWVPQLLCRRVTPLPQVSPRTACLLFALFLLPNVSPHGIPLLAFEDRSPLREFSAENEMKIPPDVIRALGRLPPRSQLLVEPGAPHLVGIYAPLYVSPYSAGYILADLRAADPSNRNPVFGPATLPGRVDCVAVEEFLRQNRADYILGTHGSVKQLGRLEVACPTLVGTFFKTRAGDGLILAVRTRR